MLQVGQLVKFANPETDNEKIERFLVLELRGERVLVEFALEYLFSRELLLEWLNDRNADFEAPAEVLTDDELRQMVRAEKPIKPTFVYLVSEMVEA